MAIESWCVLTIIQWRRLSFGTHMYPSLCVMPSWCVHFPRLPFITHGPFSSSFLRAMSTSNLCSECECRISERRSKDIISVALTCMSLLVPTNVLLDSVKSLDGSRVCALLSDSTPSLSSGCLDRASAWFVIPAL